MSVIMLTACIKFPETYTVVPPGIWRASLELSSDPAQLAEERSGGVLPFNFEIKYYTPDSFEMIIHNAEERIVCRDIAYGRDPMTGRDTVRINLPAFSSYFTGECEEDAIEGFWWDPTRGVDYKIPFKAYHGHAQRFKVDAGAGFTAFDGRWQLTIGVETEHPEPGVLIVKQNEHNVTGTILTETGDYRYLEGSVEDERMYLSTFDGSHAYLFEAKQLSDGTLSGIFRSGNHYRTYWSASRNDSVELADPYALTHLKSSEEVLDFSFPNVDGDSISLSDPRYTGKPKIITIFGTWCPNCLDENSFLTDYFRNHPDKDVEVISIAFERQKDTEKALAGIRRYQSHFNVPWEILYGGSSNKEYVATKFPALERFISFPTMIFLDQNNHIVRIHTGFYGPATDKYEAFTQEFDEILRSLETGKPAIEL